jgi:hypothetical protein
MISAVSYSIICLDTCLLILLFKSLNHVRVHDDSPIISIGWAIPSLITLCEDASITDQYAPRPSKSNVAERRDMRAEVSAQVQVEIVSKRW